VAKAVAASVAVLVIGCSPPPKDKPFGHRPVVSLDDGSAAPQVVRVPPDTPQTSVPTVRSGTAGPAPAPIQEPGPAHTDERSRVLDCIAKGETGGQPDPYRTETGNGHSGRYQFGPSTWRHAVRRAGYPQWAGRRASDAPPDVQDEAAWRLYLDRGYQPWPTSMRRCA